MSHAIHSKMQGPLSAIPIPFRFFHRIARPASL
jgi:hypothetical protein